MTFKDALELIFQKVGRYLEEKFTGKITLTFHCRAGGIGRLQIVVDEDLNPKK